LKTAKKRTRFWIKTRRDAPPSLLHMFWPIISFYVSSASQVHALFPYSKLNYCLFGNVTHSCYRKLETRF